MDRWPNPHRENWAARISLQAVQPGWIAGRAPTGRTGPRGFRHRLLESGSVAWSIWVVAGVVLAALELLAGGELWLLFAGVAAVVVGLLAGLGMTGLAPQFLVFSILAASAFFVRRRLLAPGGQESRRQRLARGRNRNGCFGDPSEQAGTRGIPRIPVDSANGVWTTDRGRKQRAGRADGRNHPVCRARMTPLLTRGQLKKGKSL